MKTLPIIIAATAFATNAAHTQPLRCRTRRGPGGSCPHGYLASGSYCVPSQGAQDAVTKPPNGTCPWGWIAIVCGAAAGARNEIPNYSRTVRAVATAASTALPP